MNKVITAWRSLLRPSEHDISTGDGRGAERLRRIALTAFASGGARFIGLLGPLITIPVTLRYLGAEQYGLWMTISAVISLFAFADLGLGNGLLTAVSRADGRDDRVEMARYISSAFFLLSGVALTFLVACVFLHPLLPWQAILSIRSPADCEAGIAATFVAFVVFALNLPVSVIQRVQLGLQKGSQSSVWQIFGSLASIIAILMAVRYRVSLAGLVLCSVGVPWMFLLFNFLWFFRLTDRDLAPRLRSIRRLMCIELLKQGSMYFVLSLLMAASFTCDNLILAHFVGQEAVTNYSIPFRLVSILASVPLMLLMPLWSANGEAIERGDIAWVRKNLKRMTALLAAITISGGIVILLSASFVLTKWFGLSEGTDLVLLTGLIGMVLGNALAGPYFMVLNGAGEVWSQVIIYAALTPMFLGSKVLAAQHFGVAGPAIAGALVSLFLLYPSARVVAIRTLNKRAKLRDGYLSSVP